MSVVARPRSSSPARVPAPPPSARADARGACPATCGSMGVMGHKIGILTPFLWTTPSGVNRQVEALVEQLTARGHRVTVIAPSDDRLAVGEAQRRVQAVLTGEQPTVFLPDEPYPRFFFAGATYAVRESRSLKLIAAPADLIANIDVLLEAEDLDVLHLNEPFVPGLGWTALRHAGCPLVATFHANPERMAPFWATRPQLRRLFDSLDAAVASSRATRDTAALTFPGAYRVIPPGVDLQRFRPGDGREPGPLRVLFAGVESRRKGLGVLLRALRHLDDRAAELTLDVCGADRQEWRYARLVPPAFAGRVRFLGRVTDAAMPDLYRRADVFCAPSLGPETAGVALLEAMACGAAVVASRLPGYDEVVYDGADGLLVSPRRPRAPSRSGARCAAPRPPRGWQASGRRTDAAVAAAWPRTAPCAPGSRETSPPEGSRRDAAPSIRGRGRTAR